MKKLIDGVFVEVEGGSMGEEEIRVYLSHIRTSHKGKDLQSVTITVDGDYVDLWYQFRPEPFERIRRITGYLVGDMGRWNNAKRAEEGDRVKHI